MRLYSLLTLFTGLFMTTLHVAPAFAATEKAIFAGGCFWCIEAELQELEGVISVVSGYTGGTTKNATYQAMGDHREAVEVVFDPAKIPYEKLLESFWDNIDPTDDGGQFYDRGSHYHTAIFYANEQQKTLAEASKMARQKRLKDPIVTPILPATAFYPAEDHHQDFYQTNPEHYNRYKTGSGRKETLKKIWKE